MDLQMQHMHEFRAMKEDDIASVLQIQSECYASAMVEDEATITRRYQDSPDTAWVAEDRHGVCAYLVAYRSVLGKVTFLGGNFDISMTPNSLYLHDLAVASRSKGGQIGSALARFSWQQALQEGLGFSSLVSVQNSREYWSRLGYAMMDPLDPGQMANLTSYPGPSWYMVKRLA